ncbi:signal peptidase II [Desulfovibrio piger]|nr:signal peptidase II [Desulfovibrio piger]
MRSRFGLLALVTLVVMVLDQWTKWLTLAYIPEHRPIPIIPGFFDLVNVRNRGAAFGFLNRSDIEWQFWLFLGATVVAVAAIIALIRSMRADDRRLVLGLGLVMGGALGNLVDRVRFRAVIDFLDFYIGAWHWPAFNVADVAICLGALLACLSLWRHPREEEPRKGTQA